MQRLPDQESELTAIRLSAFNLSLKVIPELGGKISSLECDGREILARNPLKGFRLARYGAPYSDYDASGFDECLPTIGPCLYPEGTLGGVEAPDHGELWSLPWEELPCKDGYHLRVDGVRFPYRFSRCLSFPEAGRINFRYSLENLADYPFKFIWSAHPLLAIRPGMRIHLPEGTRIKVDWSKYNRLGELLDEHTWPITHDNAGARIDLSNILPKSAGIVDKLYTTRLLEGWCALHDPEQGTYVAMLFDPQQIPYVGLSINLGGWPVDGPGYYNLGLEPCSGYPDRLDIAIQRGDYMVAPPGDTVFWEWSLFVGQANDIQQELMRLRRDTT